MTLREYLYVDERRLNSYAEQLHPQLAVDKAPEWSASLKITGPSVDGTQKLFTRTLTTHEKILVLEEHLEKGNPALLAKINTAHYYPQFTSSACCFARGSMVAQRMTLTTSAQFGPVDRSLCLWIARAPNQDPGLSHHQLWRGVCLLEDFPRDDRSPINAQFSTYSAFLGMVAAALPEFLASTQEAQTMIQDIQRRSKLGGPDENRSLSLAEDSDICGFDPIMLLTSIGAQRVGVERRIHTLFRIRQYSEWQTFGYPIFIAEANG